MPFPMQSIIMKGPSVSNVLVGRSLRQPSYHPVNRYHSAGEHLEHEHHGQPQLPILCDHPPASAGLPHPACCRAPLRDFLFLRRHGDAARFGANNWWGWAVLVGMFNGEEVLCRGILNGGVLQDGTGHGEQLLSELDTMLRVL